MKSFLCTFLLIPSVLFGQSIRNKDLSFEADDKSNTLVIKDFRTKRTWTADLSNCIHDAVITKYGSIDQPRFAAFSITDVAVVDHKARVSVKDAQTGKSYSMIVALDGSNVSFEVLTENLSAPLCRARTASHIHDRHEGWLSDLLRSFERRPQETG